MAAPHVISWFLLAKTSVCESASWTLACSCLISSCQHARPDERKCGRARCHARAHLLLLDLLLVLRLLLRPRLLVVLRNLHLHVGHLLLHAGAQPSSSCVWEEFAPGATARGIAYQAALHDGFVRVAQEARHVVHRFHIAIHPEGSVALEIAEAKPLTARPTANVGQRDCLLTQDAGNSGCRARAIYSTARPRGDDPVRWRRS